MDFPTIVPEDWAFYSAIDFDSFQCRTTGKNGMDLLVQARGNGRLLDNFQIALGGTEILEVQGNMSDFCFGPAFDPFNYRYETWGRYIDIRRNMTSSEWQEVRDLIASNNMVISNQEGEMVNPEILRMMDEAGVKGAFRWGVGVQVSGRMKLEAQYFLAAAASLSSKPALNM
jgi:hypothetical protein